MWSPRTRRHRPWGRGAPEQEALVAGRIGVGVYALHIEPVGARDEVLDGVAVGTDSAVCERIEDEDIGRIVPQPTPQEVGPDAADQTIIPTPAAERVVSGLPDQHVRNVVADQDVIPGPGPPGTNQGGMCKFSKFRMPEWRMPISVLTCVKLTRESRSTIKHDSRSVRLTGGSTSGWPSILVRLRLRRGATDGKHVLAVTV